MNPVEVSALGGETQTCWMTGHKSQFTIRGKLEIDWVNLTIRQRNSRAIGGKWFLILPAKVLQQIHGTFIEAIHLHNGGTLESLFIDRFCLQFIHYNSSYQTKANGPNAQVTGPERKWIFSDLQCHSKRTHRVPTSEKNDL
jgi:hypothetical protein